MDDSLEKKTQGKEKLEEHILDDDAVVDVSDEEEDSSEIEEVFLDSDSEECLSGTEESSFGEEDSESEEEEDNLRPVQSENGQI
jgi:hypothetical protein